MRRLLCFSAVLAFASGCIITRFPQDVAYGFVHDDMQKLHTEHAEIYFPKASRKTAEHIGGRLEQCISLLRANTQSGTPREKMQVMITSSNFNNANVAPKFIGMEARMLIPEQFTAEIFPLLGIGANEIGDVACHEAVHYVHLEEANGFWRVVNLALGNIHQPNQFAESWFLEGLATYYEGNLRKKTGRPNNPLWRSMFESGVASDPINAGDLNPFNRKQYPVGGHYLIGQHFVEHLAAKHGEKKLWEFVDVQGGAVFSPFWVTLRFKTVFGNSIGAELDEYSAHLQKSLKVRARAPEQKVLDAEVGYFGRLAVGRDGTYAVWIASRDEVPTLRIYEPNGKLRVAKPMTQIFPGRDFISSSATSISGMSFNGDGSELGFVLADVTRIGNDNARAIILNAKSGAFVRASPAFLGLGGQLSADGASFLVVEAHDHKANLAKLDIQSGRLERLTNFETYESIGAPAWSPDEKRIVFSRWSGEGFHLYVREESGQLRPVVTDGAFNYSAHWIDAERVLFTRSEEFRGQPYIADVRTGALQRAIEVPYMALDPHATPDGKLLFLNRVGWDWTVDEAPLPPPSSTEGVAAIEPSATLAPRSIEEPPLAVQGSEPYSKTDNVFYPGFRLPWVMPLVSLAPDGTATWGAFAYLAAMGADRLGIHMWALQLQYSSFDGPSLTAGYATYLTAPWLASVSASYVRGPSGSSTVTDLQGNVSVARTFYTWPVSLSFNYLDRDRVTDTDGSVFRARAVGPSASISWSGVDSTPYTGGKRGLSLTSSIAYYPRGLGSTQDVADLRGGAGFYIPLPFLKRQSFNISGVARTVPSERGRFLQVGGTGVQGVMSRDQLATARPLGTYPSLSFTEPLRGFEERGFLGESVVLGSARYRYSFIIDHGWASLLYIFPPYFIREVELELFGTIARVDPDRDLRPGSSAQLLRGAGASLAYRAAIGQIPVSLVYQYARRFDAGLGDLHVFALQFE